jgi:hypothetical protein
LNFNQFTVKSSSKAYAKISRLLLKKQITRQEARSGENQKFVMPVNTQMECMQQKVICKHQTNQIMASLTEPASLLQTSLPHGKGWYMCTHAHVHTCTHIKNKQLNGNKTGKFTAEIMVGW